MAGASYAELTKTMSGAGCPSVPGGTSSPVRRKQNTHSTNSLVPPNYLRRKRNWSMLCLASSTASSIWGANVLRVGWGHQG